MSPGAPGAGRPDAGAANGRPQGGRATDSRAAESAPDIEDDVPWLVVGLGNPGTSYAGNRHNLGYMVVDRLARDVGGRFSAHRARADVLAGRLAPAGGRPGPRVVLAKPRTFMNESGGPVSGLVRFFRVPLDRLLVVHDELDVPFGTVRLKRAGGEGGHNGLKSVSRSLGSRDYCRLRLGIGRPPGRMDPADFVLRDVPAADRAEQAIMVEEAADAVTEVLRIGFERAQGVVNATTP
jgi:PTH1 family peptidyl-tRNA hydrolase